MLECWQLWWGLQPGHRRTSPSGTQTFWCCTQTLLCHFPPWSRCPCTCTPCGHDSEHCSISCYKQEVLTLCRSASGWHQITQSLCWLRVVFYSDVHCGCCSTLTLVICSGCFSGFNWGISREITCIWTLVGGRWKHLVIMVYWTQMLPVQGILLMMCHLFIHV